MNATVISCLPGDFLSPCLITSLDGGRAMLDGLKIAGLDYACMGNHEFDLGFDGLGSLLKATTPELPGSMPAVACTTFLNSNITDQLQFLPKFKTISIGERTAVIGGFVLTLPLNP